MRNIITYLLIALIITSGLTMNAITVGAQDTGLHATQQNLTNAATEVGYNTQNSDIQLMIGSIVAMILSFLGVIFFLLTIYGGFLWMTARGNTEQVDKAKKIMVNSVVGLVIVLFAYAITWFVVSKLIDITGFDSN